MVSERAILARLRCTVAFYGTGYGVFNATLAFLNRGEYRSEDVLVICCVLGDIAQGSRSGTRTRNTNHDLYQVPGRLQLR